MVVRRATKITNNVNPKSHLMLGEEDVTSILHAYGNISSKAAQ